ncbi:ATP-binding cassette domain-containing protein [Desulfoscipio sp. XC116]|uniref:ATP-binding cassette domain-containing protein n=1 Tax=Desulfoscipio sp. XC116 TaxID=3144975 RepID=UPI00325BE173
MRISGGDKIALIGENGVGKTTLFKTICGWDKDCSGTVPSTLRLKSAILPGNLIICRVTPVFLIML